MQETCVRPLGWEDPLEVEMATHSSFLAWKIPWTQKPDGLQFFGLQRVHHKWVHTHTHVHVHTHTHTPPQGLVFTSKRVRNCLKIRQNSGQKPSSALWNPMYWDSGSVLTNLDPQRVPCEDKHEHCRSIFCISGGTVWHQVAQTRVCWIELKRHRSCFGNSSSTLWNFQSSSDCFFLQVGVELWTDVSLWSLVDCQLKSDSLNECLLSACSTLGIH